MAQETVTAHRVGQLRVVTEVAISPGGEWVAYGLAVPRDPLQGKDGPSYVELHVVDSQGKSRPFVTGEVNVGHLSWSHDGGEIRFLAKRPGDEATSLYAIPIGGGEARKLVSHPTAIAEYSFSAKGDQLAYLASDSESAERKKLREQGFNQQIYEEDVPATRVWIKSLSGAQEASKLELPGSASELHWSPVDNRLAVALAKTPLVDDHYMYRRVHIVDVESGKVLANLHNPGKLGEVRWSPDGAHLAVITGEDINDPKDGRLWLYSAAGQRVRDLLPAYPGHVTHVAWKDASTLVYMADRGVWTTVNLLHIDGSQADNWVPLETSVLHGMSLASDGSMLAAVGETGRHPGEVMLLASDQPLRRLTHSNGWLEQAKLAKQQVFSYRARDGVELQGILIRPLNEKPGTRYPLILAVHGGPESHVANGWNTSYSRPGQFAAARGFAVYYPNYRGSTGRGVEFSKLGQADAAGREFDDLVDAVDALAAKGWIDKDKVGITGGSYGGYASAWGATYYSERFAASVMFVGISDNVSKVGTTDIPEEMYHVHHRKWLWDDIEYFIRRSPIYHVQKSRTPTLILHGKEDPRVHPSQSMELYRHLKVLGKAPVRLVFYPGEGHGNRRAASRLDYSLRMLRWMEHFLQGSGDQPPPYELDYQPH